MRRLTQFGIVTVLVLPTAFGQLYLITGSTTSKYNIGFSTSLVEVGIDGLAKVNQELVPANLGTEWIAVSPDARKALILPKDPDGHNIVFDFGTTSIIKSCQRPATVNLLLINQWLINDPVRGLVFAEYLGGVNDQTDQFRGMIMDTSVPCNLSFVKLVAEDLKYFVSNGSAGVADTGTTDFMYSAIDSDGSLSRKWLTGERTYFGYQVPRDLMAGVQQPNITISVNNRDILSLEVYEGLGPNDARLLVLRKSDNTWHRIPAPSGHVSTERGFGSFVALHEGRVKNSNAPESAGAAEWRQKDTHTGPSIADRFRMWRETYPGILHLYNVATEKYYTITTNQGDSEIILVDNNTVYYRVSDRLYSAAITDTGLDPAKLLATSDIIRDAHWAFYKH